MAIQVPVSIGLRALPKVGVKRGGDCLDGVGGLRPHGFDVLVVEVKEDVGSLEMVSLGFSRN